MESNNSFTNNNNILHIDNFVQTARAQGMSKSLFTCKRLQRVQKATIKWINYFGNCEKVIYDSC